MLSLSTYLLFCAGALALIMSPGPDFFYVAARGLAGGRRAGVASALGIGTGLLVHTALAASGLTLLLLASQWVFDVVKWLGAFYLMWMGVQTVRAGESFLAPEATANLNLRATYRQGVTTNVFNPKVALTFAAFLPTFVAPARGNAPLQIAVLGATLCVLATLWFCGIGAFAGQLGALLLRYPRLARTVQLVSGSVLCGLGVRLAFAHRGTISG